MRFSLLVSRFSLTRGTIAALALLGMAALPQAVQAQTAVVPKAFATATGDNGIDTVVINSPRTYQMQVAASELGAIPVGSTITGLTFRVMGFTSFNVDSVAATFTNWDLTLAQATNTVAGMSNTFASNMTNPISVRKGALTLAAGAFTGGSSPNAFGSVISFTTPYTYQGGDLVIHVSHTGGSASAGFMDVLTNLSVGYGTGFRAINTGGYNSTTATSMNSPFTITQLSFTPSSSSAPEPGTLALLALGVVGGVVARRRK